MAVDEKSVREKARQVNDISMNYHLSHAVFACNKILEADFAEYIKKKTDNLKKNLMVAENSERIVEILKEIDRLKKPFRIHVYYFGYSDEKNTVRARVVHLPDSNQLVIYLPEAVLCRSINEDGTYNKEAVKELRKLTAHEIGHIVLHTKELLEDEGTQGSIFLSEGDTEKEADLFAEELLRLRHERNERLFKSGDWEAF